LGKYIIGGGTGGDGDGEQKIVTEVVLNEQKR